MYSQVNLSELKLDDDVVDFTSRLFFPVLEGEKWNEYFKPIGPKFVVSTSRSVFRVFSGFTSLVMPSYIVCNSTGCALYFVSQYS